MQSKRAKSRPSVTDAASYPLILSVSGPPDPDDLAEAPCQDFDFVLRQWDHPFGQAPTDEPDFAEVAGLGQLLRLSLEAFVIDHPLVEKFPHFFAIRRDASDRPVLDPRHPAPARGLARARLRMTDLPGEITDAICKTLGRMLDRGAAGFVLDGLDARACAAYRVILGRLRADFPKALLIGATPGLPREDALALAGLPFDFLLSSFGWWDMKARWLAEEHAALSPLRPLLAEITRAGASRATDPMAASGLLAAAQFTGSGLIAPLELVQRTPDCANILAMRREVGELGGAIALLASAGSPLCAILRADKASARDADRAMILLANTTREVVDIPSATLAGSPFQEFETLSSEVQPLAPLQPHEARVLRARRAKPVSAKPRGDRKGALAAAQAARIVIENITPSVSGGDYPVKRVIGDTVDVSADIYTDGHEMIDARLLWRAEGDKTWQSVPMMEEGNDVWSGSFVLDRLGRHEFSIESWNDPFGYYRQGLFKKVDAGVAQEVDFLEGRTFLEAGLESASGRNATILEKALASLAASEDDKARLAVIEDPAVVEAMEAVDPHRFSTRSAPQPIDAERLAARFSSWYELFPRSMTDDKARHGTLRDVIDHLPRVAGMGFDTLYFPPIHPIGRVNRKGPNNTLTPAADDPGSPYAIGSKEGGHEALHPELGTLEDFRALVAAAKDHGLELALDFAIQCAPDHPWLKEHPGWFAWRPDGSMKYAENPPKKYQDIVNVDFYGPDAVPDLWLALRDVVLLWAAEGVKTFRVDNPHTKPLPFWHWMIREVRRQHPEVIFLSEAFTRPKVMYRLAKAGFSQSYTYFTWRDSKSELVEYVEELTSTAPKDFFRPNFFVNTPDINPLFLQSGGRAGHRIRAVLAATLSGLWGVYSGFELCDATPLPGREEYLDSEKYEIRPREWRRPGDIVDDIAMLNRLRRGHPGLQTHLNTRFYTAHDDNIIYYGKPAPDGGDMILVAVNMDPHAAHACEFEVPLWEFGLPDHASIAVEDLVRGDRFSWTGKMQYIHLAPDEPYRIWRIEPFGEGHA